MEHTLDPKHKVMYRAVGEILHYVWDPIGVAGLPQARDEYDSYVAQVFSLVRSGASEPEIAAFLAKIAADLMGLDQTQRCSARAASVLVDWRDHLNEQPA